MVYIKKFKRNRPQNLRGVMRPRGHSFLEESLGHPRVRRSLMRALVGNPMDMTPFDLVHMERLRAASRTTRRRTQELYEEEGLQDMAQRERVEHEEVMSPRPVVPSSSETSDEDEPHTYHVLADVTNTIHNYT